MERSVSTENVDQPVICTSSGNNLGFAKDSRRLLRNVPNSSQPLFLVHWLSCSLSSKQTPSVLALRLITDVTYTSSVTDSSSRHKPKGFLLFLDQKHIDGCSSTCYTLQKI
jgi:hypothetical protein